MVESRQAENREDESTLVSEPINEQPLGKVESADLKPEATAALPQRRASTSNPPNKPVKLLTRLGSLEGEVAQKRLIWVCADLRHSLTLIVSSSGAPRPPVKKSPATLPRNFTLPKDPHGSLLRGRMSTPTGSPHLGSLHQQLPPSCIIEELHRALATKHRQDRSAFALLWNWRQL